MNAILMKKNALTNVIALLEEAKSQISETSKLVKVDLLIKRLERVNTLLGQPLFSSTYVKPFTKGELDFMRKVGNDTIKKMFAQSEYLERSMDRSSDSDDQKYCILTRNIVKYSSSLERTLSNLKNRAF